MVERVRHLDQGGFRVFLGMLLCVVLTSIFVALTRGTSFGYAVLDYLVIALVIFCGVPFVALTPTHWVARLLFALLSVGANVAVFVMWGIYLSCFGFGSCMRCNANDLTLCS